jgi:hypothetical protein
VAAGRDGRVIGVVAGGGDTHEVVARRRCLERQARVAALLGVLGQRTAARVEHTEAALQGAAAGLRADGDVDRVAGTQLDPVELEVVGRGEKGGGVASVEGGERQRHGREGEDDAALQSLQAWTDTAASPRRGEIPPGSEEVPHA